MPQDVIEKSSVIVLLVNEPSVYTRSPLLSEVAAGHSDFSDLIVSVVTSLSST